MFKTKKEYIEKQCQNIVWASGICGLLRGKDTKTPAQYKLQDSENMFTKGAKAVIETDIDNFSPANGFGVCMVDSVECPKRVTTVSSQNPVTATTAYTTSVQVTTTKPSTVSSQNPVTATTTSVQVTTTKPSTVSSQNPVTATTATTPTAQVTTQPVTKDYYEIVVPVSTYDPATNPTSVYAVVPETAAELTEEFCRNACKKAIEGTSCEAIVSNSFYVDACITDLHATGDKTVIESNRLAYAQTCATYSKTTGNSTLELKQEIGFDHYTCPKNCTSIKHGICGENGCECLPDYSGFDCSILLVMPIQSAPTGVLLTSAQPSQSLASTPTSAVLTASSTSVVPPEEEQPIVAAASSIQAHIFIVLTAFVFVV